ncbi:LpxL/LpxP family Kdo(2)-lipid IV(A) lauroyl/palmitoleoyl acyltransferase [Vibrio sp. JC009]|uniref:LpxL/LpxP family Kdo(2)-lipid IV(A) lauroyl/palmitoleoyl acyltransferase n=1 Tax=Vibrio sp. JC009 TaxID=2912314 RepID=UPI0023AEF554|nr:LpxL/LpxP family Kdo(2)-lipid IV(A) lauroyl/palmitoleoyl acyltransferase [Vibrio sp. JC009]WED23255.1 LpxL/LpxP family Kdo(2)-lipid IV(A) lauroyl/palmitoleoyl acyltransferase [Vibrio sp. JC009]
MNMSKRSIKPTFTISLLHPKNWGVWLGFGFLALFVNIMPYRVLLFTGRKIGQIGMKYGQKRVHVASRNLELSFPEKSKEEIDAIVVENFKNTGMALIETGIAWFWPAWRLKRFLTYENMEQLSRYEEEGKGALLCFVHALNLEIAARAFGIAGMPGHGVYRPHTNPAYDFIQYWGRTHNGNTLVDRRDLKEMIRVLRKGQRLFYLPDHDYGHNKSVFVPFFAVEEACTTTGPSILAYPSHCAIISGSGFRTKDGKYEIILDDSMHEIYPQKDMEAAAALMNKYMEKVILRGLDQWMWLHKRFKSMPDHDRTNERYL